MFYYIIDACQNKGNNHKKPNQIFAVYAHNLYLCIRFEKDNKKSQSQKVEAETLKLLTRISQKVKKLY